MVTFRLHLGSQLLLVLQLGELVDKLDLLLVEMQHFVSGNLSFTLDLQLELLNVRAHCEPLHVAF